MAINQIQLAVSKGGVDITSRISDAARARLSVGQRRFAIPRPRAFATRDEQNRALEKAIRTGVFRANEFRLASLLPTRVPTVAEALVTQKVKPQVLESLRRQGRITREEATTLKTIGRGLRTEEEIIKTQRQIRKIERGIEQATAKVGEESMVDLGSGRFIDLKRATSDPRGFARQQILDDLSRDVTVGRLSNISANLRKQLEEEKRLLEQMKSITELNKLERDLAKLSQSELNRRIAVEKGIIKAQTQGKISTGQILTKTELDLQQVKLNKKLRELNRQRLVLENLADNVKTVNDLKNFRDSLARFFVNIKNFELSQKKLGLKLTNFQKLQLEQSLITQKKIPQTLGKILKGNVPVNIDRLSFGDFVRAMVSETLPEGIDLPINNFLEKSGIDFKIVKGKGANFDKAMSETAEGLVSLTELIPRETPLSERDKNIIRFIGSGLGFALAGLDTGTRAVVNLGATPLSRQIGLTVFGKTEFLLPEFFTETVTKLRAVDPIIITNPLKAVRIDDTGRRFIVGSRAVGQVGGLVLDVALIYFPLKKTGLIAKVTKSGKFQGILGRFNLVKKSVRTSFFNKIRVSNLRKISTKGIQFSSSSSPFFRRLRKVPEINALFTRTGFEATRVSKVLAGATVKSFDKLAKVNSTIAKKLVPLNEIILKGRLRVAVTNFQVREALKPIQVYLRELKSISKRSTGAFKKSIDEQIKLINNTISKVRPTIIRKGDFNQFAKVKELQRTVSNSIERVSSLTGKKLKIITRPVKKLRKTFVIQKARAIVKQKAVFSKVRLVKSDYSRAIINLKREFSSLSKPLQKKFKKSFDSLLFQFTGRKEVLDDFLKARAKFSKVDSITRAKLLQKEFKKIETIVLADFQKFKAFPRIKVFQFKKIVKKELLRLKRTTPAIKISRSIARINNVTKDAIFFMQSSFRLPNIRNLPKAIKDDLLTFFRVNQNAITKKRNALVKFIKGKKLVAQERARLRGFQKLGLQEQARRFESAVKRAVLEYNEKYEKFTGFVLPKPTTTRVGIKFRAIIKQRPLVRKGIRNIIKKGKLDFDEIEKLITSSIRSRSLTPKQASVLRKFNKSVFSKRKLAESSSLRGLVKEKNFITDEQLGKLLSAKKKLAPARIRRLTEKGLRKIIDKGFVAPRGKLVGVRRFSVSEIDDLISNALKNRTITRETARKLKGLNLKAGLERAGVSAKKVKSVVDEFADLKVSEQLQKTNFVKGRIQRNIQRNLAKQRRLARRELGIKLEQIDVSRKRLSGAARRKSPTALSKKEALFIKRETARLKATEKQVDTFLRGFRKGKTKGIRTKLKTARRQADVLSDSLKRATFKRGRIQRNIQKNLARQRRLAREELGIRVKGLDSFPRRTARRQARRALKKQQAILEREARATTKELRLLRKKAGLVISEKDLNRLIRKQKLEIQGLLLKGKIKPIRPFIRLKKVVKKKPKVFRGKRTIQIQKQKTSISKAQKELTDLQRKLRRVETKSLKAKVSTQVRQKKLSIQRAKSRLVQFAKRKPKAVKRKFRGPIITLEFQKQKSLISPKLRKKAVEVAKQRNLLRVNVRVKQIQSFKQIPAQKLAFRELAKLRLMEAVAERLIVIQNEAVVELSLLSPRLREAIRVAQAQAKTATKTKLKTRLLQKPPLLPIIPLPKKQTLSFESIARRKGPFNVVARVRGKVKRINRFPLNGRDALAFGGNRVDNRAIRSFGIVKGKGRVKKIRVPPFNKKKFRKPTGNSKIQRFFIVEKVKFAIDTIGEKREITRKGLKVLKVRGRKKRKVKGKIKRKTKKRVKKRKVTKKKKLKRRKPKKKN